MNAQHVSEKPMIYSSVIADWDGKSSVRSKPRRHPHQDGLQENYFSVILTPTSTHPLVVDRGPEDVRTLLARRLYSYMNFTTILEQEIVNPVVLRLSRDAYGLTLPDAARFDAHKIYCDEAYHAVLSVDIVRQVCAGSGVLPGRTSEPQFARAIREAKASARPELAGLIEFSATVVSETLISGSLTQIPSDETVALFIREAIADHAADERTHHAYFTKVFEIAWPQLDSNTRRLIGPLFADFILAFLAPDLGGQREALRSLGLSCQDTAQVVWESYPMARTVADARHAARSTIRLLDRMGIFDDPRTEEHFCEVGLIGDQAEGPDTSAGSPG